MEQQTSRKSILSAVGRALVVLVLCSIVFILAGYGTHLWINRPWTKGRVEDRVAAIFKENKIQHGGGSLVVKMINRGHGHWSGTVQIGRIQYQVRFDETSPNGVDYNRLTEVIGDSEQSKGEK